jgi:hypothetical protein
VVAVLEGEDGESVLEADAFGLAEELVRREVGEGPEPAEPVGGAGIPGPEALEETSGLVAAGGELLRNVPGHDALRGSCCAMPDGSAATRSP